MNRKGGRVNVLQKPCKENFESPRSRGKQTINEFAKAAAQELDQHYPRMEIPKLHCFAMNFDEKDEGDPVETERRRQLKEGETSRKIQQRQTRKMYQIAQAHSSATSRILDQHGDDLHLALIGPDLNTVLPEHINDPRKMQAALAAAEAAEEAQAHYSKWLRNRQMHSIREETWASSGPGTATPAAAAASSVAESEEDATTPNYPPLTLGEVYAAGEVKEAKAASTLWPNYLRAACPDK